MSWLSRLMPRRQAPVPDPMALARSRAEAGDHEGALALWEPLARAGDARACNNIGACFAEGFGVPRDAVLALHWLTLSADAGDPVGQRNLASLLFKGGGEGVPADGPRAARLYRASAEQGDAISQDMLSWMLLEGGDIAADPAEAMGWATKAASAGIAAAMTRLGMIHHNALGVPRDAAEAARWWRRGAEAGDADGQAMLGAALTMGSGATKDPEEALAWLLRAQANGSALAGSFLPAARSALDAEALARAEARARAPLGEAA